MSEYIVTVPKRHFNQIIWNTTPSNTRIKPILRLYMPNNAHTWIILFFFCIQIFKKIEKKKERKIDLPTLPIFRPKGQTNLLYFKGGQMGHYDMVSLWYASLLTNTRFRFLFFRMNNCLLYLMLHKGKELPNDSVRPLSYHNFTDKKQNGCC